MRNYMAILNLCYKWGTLFSWNQLSRSLIHPEEHQSPPPPAPPIFPLEKCSSYKWPLSLQTCVCCRPPWNAHPSLLGSCFSAVPPTPHWLCTSSLPWAVQIWVTWLPRHASGAPARNLRCCGKYVFACLPYLTASSQRARTLTASWHQHPMYAPLDIGICWMNATAVIGLMRIIIYIRYAQNVENNSLINFTVYLLLFPALPSLATSTSNTTGTFLFQGFSTGFSLWNSLPLDIHMAPFLALSLILGFVPLLTQVRPSLTTLFKTLSLLPLPNCPSSTCYLLTL